MLPNISPASPLANLQKRSELLRKKLLTHKKARKFYTKSYLLALNLRQKSARLLASAGLTGTLLMTPMSPPSAQANTVAETAVLSMQTLLTMALQPLTPHTPSQLESDQAEKIEQAIETASGLKVKANLNGQMLNHQVGYIGYEQHLQRFPGDTLLDHDDEQVAGIAPGLGAWGYFAPSRSQFTTKDYLREKWYSVAQTLYLPDWNTDFVRLRDWYKYRKVLIINPENGSAVVSVIGDAGPADWTGKQFGGSPEVMKALNLHLGRRKGLVLFLFLDDPQDQIPLGPLNQRIRQIGSSSGLPAGR
ncbi:hypothetical protein HY333_01635 [Candidatus Collierbacteria bacterium]|nr:hypothetical protein [Candidatus Collierbacteria bacterium]